MVGKFSENSVSYSHNNSYKNHGCICKETQKCIISALCHIYSISLLKLLVHIWINLVHSNFNGNDYLAGGTAQDTILLYGWNYPNLVHYVVLPVYVNILIVFKPKMWKSVRL